MDQEIREAIHLCRQEIERLEDLRKVGGPSEEIEAALGARRDELAQWREIASRRTAPAHASLPSTCERSTASSATSGDEVSTRYPLPPVELIAARIRSLQTESDARLIEIAKRACDALHPDAMKKGTYADLRPWIHAAHTLMTDRATLAPAVRPVPPMGKFVHRAHLTDTQKLILNDRQLFDLEYAHKHRLGKPRPRWQALLRSDAFDRSLAAGFITTMGKPEYKVAALGLRDDEQMRLRTIRSDAVRKRWERLEHVADALQEFLETERRLGACKIAEADLPRWREDFIALEIAAGSPKAAALILHALFGRFKPANQFANRKLDLKRKMAAITKAAA